MFMNSSGPSAPPANRRTSPSGPPVSAFALASSPGMTAVLPALPAEVRIGLVGFGNNERLAISTILSSRKTGSTTYVEWRRNMSPRPDLFLLDAGFAGVADMLRLLDPHVRVPALWVGSPSTEQFKMRTGSIFRRPLQWSKLPEMLGTMMQQRLRNSAPLPAVHAIAYSASALVATHETDRGHALGALLGPHEIEYVLVPSGEAAVASARVKPFALVMMDGTSPGIDVYRACHLLKTGAAEKFQGRNPGVVLLVPQVTRDARKMAGLAHADAIVERDAPQAFLAETIAKLLTSG